MGEQTKHCNKCNTTKPFSGFHKSKAKWDGVNAICATCAGKACLAWRTAPEGRARSLWASAKSRAESKGVAFDLTPAWIEARLLAGVCEATGIPLELAGVQVKKTGPERPWTPSLDRTDAGEGYTADNVRVVCWMYNQAKGSATPADVIRFAKALANV